MADGKMNRRDFMQTSAAAGVAATLTASKVMALTADEVEKQKKKTRSYNPDMEYRRLGKTGLWISACCIGGHWKRIDNEVPGIFKGRGWLSAGLDDPRFEKNRRDVISKCIESGMNYIDACTREECITYSKALAGRRDKMYLGFSWYQEEMRRPNFRTADALLGTLEKGMKAAKQEYVDVWRITLHERSSRHTEAEMDEAMKALDTARKQGKCRFCGVSTHDRPHIAKIVEQYNDVLQVVVTPYTADSRELPKHSMFDAVRKHDVGVFGIKPFASNSLFKGNSKQDNEHAKEDDERARLAIRYILHNPAITAPIPGLVNVHQVENVVAAVKERRAFAAEEQAKLKQATEEMWANLPPDYQWLKEWKHV
jgi:aryl-alcohol dehydrogenase-like predicted oxidoreductase